MLQPHLDMGQGGLRRLGVPRVLSLLLGEPAHDSLHGQGVLDVKRLRVVLLKQGEGLLSGYFHGDSSRVKDVPIVPPGEKLVNVSVRGKSQWGYKLSGKRVEKNPALCYTGAKGGSTHGKHYGLYPLAG